MRTSILRELYWGLRRFCVNRPCVQGVPKAGYEPCHQPQKLQNKSAVSWTKVHDVQRKVKVPL